VADRTRRAAKLRVTRLRYDRHYLSNTICRSIIALNVLPRNESAYDVDARRIDNDAPIACRHQMRPGWRPLSRDPTNGAFSMGPLPLLEAGDAV
jgi:hypothetical protein